MRLSPFAFRRIKRWLYSRSRWVDFFRLVKMRMGFGTPFVQRLKLLLSAMGDFTFIQIGAHDGFTGDPYRVFILETAGPGVLVEPQRSLQPLLQANYKYRPNLAFEEAAVTKPGVSSVTLFVSPLQNAAQETEPASFLASLSKGHVETYIPGEAIAHEVPAVTVEQLVSKHHLPHLDCLFLDVEGEEASIILSLDLRIIAPKVICFEWVHIAQVLRSVREHLETAGYHLETFDMDIIAWRTSGLSSNNYV